MTADLTLPIMISPGGHAHSKRSDGGKAPGKAAALIEGLLSHIYMRGSFCALIAKHVPLQISFFDLFFAQSGQSVSPETHFQPSTYAIFDSVLLLVAIPFSKSVLRLLAHLSQVRSKYVSILIFIAIPPFLLSESRIGVFR